MKPFKLSPLHQVEYAVTDIAQSQHFFQQVFGESEVEKTFSEVLTNPALAISHAGFGETVQQFCQPLMEGLPHYDALEAFGPCVHNLCYLVDNIDTIVANCADAGLKPLIEFPMDDNWRKLISQENLQGNHQSYIINTRAVFGFQLELAETPWITEPVPPLMLPAHGPQWAQLGVASGHKLHAINVVVDDLEHTLEMLHKVFVDNVSVVAPPMVTTDGLTKTMIVTLGLIRMVYLQPLQSESVLGSFIQQRGPAVHSLVAYVNNLSNIETSLQSAAVKSSPAEDILLAAMASPQQKAQPALQVHSIDNVGVEFTLVEASL